MKIGEIKAEALKLMGIALPSDVTAETVEQYKNDPSYASFLYAMDGAILRALDRFYVTETIEKSAEHVSEAEELPSVLARMIPHFIVGDVFSGEDGSAAANHRNIFEALLDEYVKSCRREAVEIVYGVNAI